MKIVIDRADPRDPEMTALLQAHLDFCMSVTPPESVYALDVSKLVNPAITVFGAKLDETLVGVGALRILDSNHGELKSMHTAKVARGQGVGRAMVSHLLEFAAAQGLTRVSLETGNYEEFAPARRLYESFGFEECEVFGEYLPSAISVCMTKYLL